jgi:RimJ/RimL family protein N-acetyltransferase/aryl carrier-like protein
MTTTESDPALRTDPSGPEARREARRRDLATLLELDPALLSDQALLVEDLGLDSLAMMTVISWLAEQGVVIGTDRGRLASVADVLDLMPKSTVSIVVTGTHNGNRLDPGRVPGPALPRPASPLVPVLENRIFRLTPIEDADVGFLYDLATRPETCFRWRFRGAPPPFDRFVAELWTLVVVQFVVRRTEDDQPVGHVVAYSANRDHGHCYVGAVFSPGHTGTGFAAQATELFVRYLFHSFAFRKVYLEIPGYNWDLVRSGEGRLFDVEGVLREHDYHAGRYWDQYLCAIHRSRLAGAGSRPADGAAGSRPADGATMSRPADGAAGDLPRRAGGGR